MRYPTVTHERPTPDETPKERAARCRRNRLSREQADAWRNAWCRCGMKQGHVVHNVDPEDQIEGPKYYADVKDLHEFIPARWDETNPQWWQVQVEWRGEDAWEWLVNEWFAKVQGQADGD